MTLEQFLATYRFNFREQNLLNGNYVITTDVIRRNNNQVVSTVKTSVNITEASDWIEASQTPFSLNDWDWNQLIEQTKRGQLDYFAQRVPITDFFPLNTETDITRVTQ